MNNDNMGHGPVLKAAGDAVSSFIGWTIILVLATGVIPVIYLIAWGAYLLVKLLTY
jgi:hypothetical protein